MTWRDAEASSQVCLRWDLPPRSRCARAASLRSRAGSRQPRSSPRNTAPTATTTWTKRAGSISRRSRYTPDDPANFARWVKVHDRLQAGEMPPKEEEAARRGGARRVSCRAWLATLTASERETRRARGPRHAAPAQWLRIRKRPAGSVLRAVAAGEGPVPGRRRGVSLQQDRRRARRLARPHGALHERRRLRDAPGDERPVRAAADDHEALLRARSAHAHQQVHRRTSSTPRPTA